MFLTSFERWTDDAAPYVLGFCAVVAWIVVFAWLATQGR
jgi:hypothetical protein